ncbi:MAG: hypothetical protein HRT86_08970 [Ilumatobacteraceae bacterium]|nr:hypothetical protein [Ilumatobacteraceae bacterium]
MSSILTDAGCRLVGKRYGYVLASSPSGETPRRTVRAAIVAYARHLNPIRAV